MTKRIYGNKKAVCSNNLDELISYLKSKPKTYDKDKIAKESGVCKKTLDKIDKIIQLTRYEN